MLTYVCIFERGFIRIYFCITNRIVRTIEYTHGFESRYYGLQLFFFLFFQRFERLETRNALLGYSLKDD